MRIALIGLGRMASWIEDEGGICSHAFAIRQLSNLNLVGGCDPSPAARAAFAERWGISSVYEDVPTLLEQQSPDVVVIASPSHVHLKHVEAVSACPTVKIVVCEKPLAASTAEAMQVERIVSLSGKKLAVNHSRRWCAVYEAGKNWVASGEIGEVKRIHAWYGNGVMNIGTHLMDALFYLVGEFSSVRAISSGGRSDDPDIDGILSSEEGFSAVLQTNSSRSFLVFEIEVMGTEGVLRIVGNGQEVQLWQAPSPGGVLQRVRTVCKPPGEQPIITLFQEIGRPDFTPRCSAGDGVAAVRAAEALLYSSRHGNTEISLSSFS